MARPMYTSADIRLPSDLTEVHECDFCRRLVLDLRRDINDVKDNPVPTDLKASLTLDTLKRLGTSLSEAKAILRQQDIVVFDVTLHNLRTAADQNCVLSEWLLRSTPLTGQCEGPSLLSDEQDSLLTAEMHSDGVVTGMITFGLLKISSGGIARQPSPHFGTYQMLGEKDTLAARELCAQMINTNPASKSALSLARTWLDTCLYSHQNCPLPKQNFMPKRLLRLRGSKQNPIIRLARISSSHHAPYAALSYCWGGPQQMKTTTATLPLFQIYMRFSKLPKTIQDAARITMELGIKFVWIDAFCIVQDDEEDKREQIARMPDIYGQSTVTIIASRANGVAEGFLCQRETPHPAFRLPYRCDNGSLDRVTLLPWFMDRFEPLDRRGWALQERMLSIRTLDFDTLQTRWTCREMTGAARSNECWVDGWRFEDTRNEELFTRNLIMNHGAASLVGAGAEQELYKSWYNIVESYTRRKLTLPSDRLAAIDGVANQFMSSLRDQYLSGLWQGDLLHGLCWQPSHYKEYKWRPPIDISPSWSWGAVNKPVSFPEPEGRIFDTALEIIGLSDQFFDPDLADRATSYRRQGGALYSMNDRELKLRGRVRKVSHSVGHTAGSISATNLPLCHLMPDSVQSISLPTGTAVSLLLLRVDNSTDGLFGLVLAQLDSERHKRIGTFSLLKFVASEHSSISSHDGNDQANSALLSKQIDQEDIDEFLSSDEWEIKNVILV